MYSSNLLIKNQTCNYLFLTFHIFDISNAQLSQAQKNITKYSEMKTIQVSSLCELQIEFERSDLIIYDSVISKHSFKLKFCQR